MQALVDKLQFQLNMMSIGITMRLDQLSNRVTSIENSLADFIENENEKKREDTIGDATAQS